MAFEECLDEVGRYQRIVRRLRELGINPRYAGSEIRELAKRGKLTRELLLLYFDLMDAKRDIIRCVYRAIV